MHIIIKYNNKNNKHQYLASMTRPTWVGPQIFWTDYLPESMFFRTYKDAKTKWNIIKETNPELTKDEPFIDYDIGVIAFENLTPLNHFDGIYRPEPKD